MSALSQVDFRDLLAAELARGQAQQGHEEDGPTLIHTPDPRVNDLLDGMITTVRNQMTSLGGVSPMSRYSLMWIRDTAGAVRFFLRVGLHEEARAMLDYYYRAACHNGDMANAVRLDYDTEPADVPDWAAMAPMTGRTAAEGPSHLPLMAWWYLLATGDQSLIEEQYQFLRRAVLGQAVDEDGLLPFSGDETYRAAMAVPLGYEIEHDFVSCCRSANSSFLFVAAAEAMAVQAELLGYDDDTVAFQEAADRVRAAAEATFLRPDGAYAPFWDPASPSELPPPFEDVGLAPLWSGYHTPDDPAAAANVEALVALLCHEDGSFQSAPHARYSSYMGLDLTEGIYTGMVPGYGLYNLAVLDHPVAEAAFNLLGIAASPSGNYAEYQIHDDHSALQVIYDDRGGGLADVTARYRPWEGAINLDAMIVYLTGFQPNAIAGEVHLAPRLPNQWPYLSVRRLRMGDAVFHLDVEELGGERQVTVTPQAPDSPTVVLAVPLRPAEIEAVVVNGSPLPEDGYALLSPCGGTRVQLPPIDIPVGTKLEVTVRYTAR